MRLLPTRLGLKLMVWIAGTLLVLFVFFVALMIRQETRRSLDWTREMGEVITRTVEKSMEQSMNQGDMKAIQAMMENVATVSDVVRLRLVASEGVVTRSSSPSEVGDVLRDPRALETLRTGRGQSAVDESGAFLRVLSPLANGESCQECHRRVPPGQPLGVLDLSLSVGEKMAAVRRTMWQMVLWGLGMVLAVCATLFVLLHRLVLKNVASLSHAAGLMARGNTSISVDVHSEDEIGQLGEAFNRMAVNVNDAHEKNTSLIRGISDPLLTVDSELRVTFMNEPMELLTGFRQEEVVGRLSCKDILRCDHCQEACHLQRIVQGQEASGVERMQITTRTGKLIPVVASDSVLRDARGRIIGAITIVRDVTREREAEQLLANEVSWSQSVIKAIADPMFTVDSEKGITFANDAALALAGWTREDAMGQKCHRVFRGEICRKECIYDRSVKEGQSVHGMERNVLPKEGREVLARASGSVLLTADGAGVGFLEIMRDVTDEQRNILNLLDVLKHIQTASDTIGSMSKDILRNSEEQKQGVSEQSSSVKEVATTIEELDITSQQTAEKAEGVVKTAQRTVQISQDGQKAVQENIQVMNLIRGRVESIAEQILELSQQAQQIGSIITAVNDLAEQTNLLALNAAIEAARAGEHGRGFTVVAMEVKKLAEQSQAATAKIAALINEIQQATRTCVQVTEEGARGVEDGVRLAGTAGETIQQVMHNVSDTADAVQQIATIAKQQSVGIQQVSIAMSTINTGMNQTTRSAERLSDAAGEFNRLAGQLTDLVRKYKL